VETSAISYRVADFLKQYPPFSAMAEGDLVSLAANGRVRFYEAQEFILWQGEPHKAYVFVIQQGTVSVWDERNGVSELRDVRGAGDLVGAERFHGERSVLFSVRAASDVLLYGFAEEDFYALLEKYPYAQQFVAALGTVIGDFQRGDEQPDPQRLFLHTVASQLPSCTTAESLADAARTLSRSGAEALAVTDADSQILGLVSPGTILGWIADGRGGVERPLGELPLEMPPALAPDASIADGAIALGTSTINALAITEDGHATGRVLSVITARDLAAVFGDNPAAILQDIRRAADFDSLRALNRRARACALRYLTSASSTDWLTRFIESVDVAIVTRAIELTTGDDDRGC
jgi:CBS domain-containing protein